MMFTFNPVGIVLAVVFLGALLLIFRWMLATSPRVPRELDGVATSFSNLRRIVVPLIDPGASAYAVDLTCRLASNAQSEIILAHVIVVPLSLSLDASLLTLEAEGVQRLTQAGYQVSQWQLQFSERMVRARTEVDGILQLVRDVDADLIMLGICAPRRGLLQRENPTVRELLCRAPSQVVFAQVTTPVETLASLRLN